MTQNQETHDESDESVLSETFVCDSCGGEYRLAFFNQGTCGFCIQAEERVWHRRWGER